MSSDDLETIYRSPTPEWRLRIIDGFDVGDEFVLTDTQEYTIGRKDCDINVNPQDMKASRLHARLEFKNGQPFLENLSRTTDTYVNNNAIKKKRKLKSGNKIGVGNTVFILQRTGDSKPRTTINIKKIGIGACIFILALVILKWVSNSEPEKTPTSSSPPETTPSLQPTAAPTITATPSVSPLSTVTTTTTIVPEKTPQPIDREKADEFYRQGKYFYKNGRLKKAISYFNSALKNYPGHPYASDSLKEARNKLDESVNELIKEAEEAQRLVKIDLAKQHLREIMGLLSDNPQDKRYIDAQKKLHEIENR